MVRGRYSVCLERLRFYCTTHPFQAFAVSNIGLLEWVGHLPSVFTYQVPGSGLTSGLSVLSTRVQVPFFFSTYSILRHWSKESESRLALLRFRIRLNLKNGIIYDLRILWTFLDFVFCSTIHLLLPDFW